MTQTTILENTVFEQNKKMSKWKFTTIFTLSLSGVFTVLSTPTLCLLLVFGFIFFALLGLLTKKSEKKIIIAPTLFLMRAWMVSFYLATFFFMGSLFGKGINLLIPHNAVPYIGTAIGLFIGIITLITIIRRIRE